MSNKKLIEELRYYADIYSDEPVAKKLLNAAEELEKFEWLPIETIPFDEYVLVTDGDICVCAKYTKIDGGYNAHISGTGKAEIKMWKHILKNWLKLNFKHSSNTSYVIDNKNHLHGSIVEVFCNCGESFYKK